jgi:DNA-binding PadR family transcriptional regulator
MQDDSGVAPALSPGEWAVLGLLAERPNHGFALKKELEPAGALGRVWSLPGPLVYRALTTLQAKGMASVVASEHSDLGPQRTVLTATATGRAGLARWLAQPVRHLREVRAELMLKLALLDRAGADPAPLLTAQRAVFEPLVAALEARHDAGHGFDRTLLRWRLESGRAALRFLDACAQARHIEAGGEKWSRRADSNR